MNEIDHARLAATEALVATLICQTCETLGPDFWQAFATKVALTRKTFHDAQIHDVAGAIDDQMAWCSDILFNRPGAEGWLRKCSANAESSAES